MTARANGPLSSAVRTHGFPKQPRDLASKLLLPQEVYQIDDGTAEDAVGLSLGGDLIALSQFTVISGQNQIGSVNIAWGTPAFPDPSLDGLPYTVAIWSDPNGDGSPNDAQLLATASGAVSQQGTDTFIDMAFSPAVTVTNSFFVGFLIPNTAAGQFPAAFDQSNPIFNRSFVAGSAAGNGNIENLNDNDFPVGAIERVGWFGNWLIRADPGSAGGTLQFLSAQSLKGRFGVDLPGIEDRTGGLNKRYTIAYAFNNNITSVDGAITNCGTVSSTGVSHKDAHVALVSLVGVGCDGGNVTATLNGIHDDQGNTLSSADATMTLIVGDVDADGSVTTEDLLRVKKNKGENTDTSNFRSDVNASGHIDAADAGIIRNILNK